MENSAQCMKSRRLHIEEALQCMIHAQRAREFQWLAVQIGKLKWPELEATSEQADGGEDGTSFVSCADGKVRRLAVSLTGTLEKIRNDATRLQTRGVKLDVLVFLTPVALTHLQVADWCKTIEDEFQHGLHVISRAELVALLEQPTNADLCRRYLGLDFADEPEIEDLETAARSSAKAILADWRNEFGFDTGVAIELTLARESDASAGSGSDRKLRRTNMGELCQLVSQRGRIALMGPPGAGKTFTLIQIAESLLKEAAAPIPILVSLPGWAAQGSDIQAYLEQQLRNRGISEASFTSLRAAGRIALLLNGWNEVPESFGASKAAGQLQDFALTNASTPLVISTRATHLAPPIARPIVVRIYPLSPEQRSEVIRRSGLSHPSQLSLAIARTPTLSGVTETPLFLAGIIELARSGVEELPASRFSILEAMVSQVERKGQAALTEKPCEGLHRYYLAHIAYVMTRNGKTVLSQAEFLNAVAETAKTLQSAGHISSAPASLSVIESLARHHLVVFSPSVGGAYRFVHQQFQEWFASLWLYEQVIPLARELPSNRKITFQRNVLNHFRWFTSLAFLLERLGSGNEQEREAAATVVEWAVQIDLILAAELAGIAGKVVWSSIREFITPAVRSWHARGGERHRRCALGAMLATGAPDFQDILWPLLESDEQTMRWSCRAWHPFPLTSLGAGFGRRFSEWDDHRRRDFVQEMGLAPNGEHIALAAGLAKSDPSPEVKLAALDLLAGVGAYDAVEDILNSPGFGEWPSCIYAHLLRRLSRAYLVSIAPRMKAAFDKAQDVSVRSSILELLRLVSDPEWLARAKIEIQRLSSMPGVSLRAQYWLLRDSEKAQVNVGPYLAEYLDQIFEVDSAWAKDWLVAQLVEGRLWEEPFTEHLNTLAGARIEKLTSAALKPTSDLNADYGRVALFASTGSVFLAKAILTEHLEWVKETQHQKFERSNSFNRGDVLRNGIHKLPLPCVVDAILEIAPSINDFSGLRVLLATVLPGLPIHAGWRAQLSGKQREQIRSLVLRLDELEPSDLQDKNYFRSELAGLLGAVGNGNDAKLIEAWLETERQRQVTEEAEWQAKFEASRKSGRSPCRLGPRQIRMAWNSWCEALAQIGGAEGEEILFRYLQIPEFLEYASWGLVNLLNQTERDDLDRTPGYRPAYSEIYSRRKKRVSAAGSISETRNRYAEVVQKEILKMVPALAEPTAKIHRHALYRAAAALARLDPTRAVPVLLALCLDKQSHWTVAMALHGLLMDGIVLPGKAVADALEPFIAEHEKESWSGQDQWHAVAECLAVLLFSDDPRVGVERIRQLPPNRTKSHHLRDVLYILGSCRAPEAGELLDSFTDDPEVLDRYPHELMTALSENGSPVAKKSVLQLFNRLAAGQRPSPRDLIEPLAKALAHFAATDAGYCATIQTHCREANTTVEREVLAHCLHLMDTEAAALAVCDLIRDDARMPYEVVRLVQGVAENRVPAGGGGAYYLQPRGAGPLRRRLYEIARSDATRRLSALELLAVIAECRLEHGMPPDEPFHPDADTLADDSVPWPLIQ